MEKVDLVKRAKYYMDSLSEGIDPLSGIEILGDSILEHEKIKKCFKFISNILDDIIDNEEKVGQVIDKKQKFSLNEEQLKSIHIVTKPITMFNFVRNINRAIDDKKMEKLSVTTVYSWLLKNGFLKLQKTPKIINANLKVMTEKSVEIGIISHDKINPKTGEVTPEIMLTAQTQEFVLQNIDKILNKK